MARHSYALVPASHVYLLRDGEVLLQQRKDTGYMDGYWVAGAAGHIEPGETAREAAAREAFEEIGVSIHPKDLKLVTVMQRTDGSDNPREQRVDWFWTTYIWSGAATLREPHKASRIEWFPLDDLPNLVPDYERLVLQGLSTDSLPMDTSAGFDV